MARSIRFVINPEGQELSLELFQKAIDDVRRLINDLDYAVTRERGKRRWLIQELHSSAPTITVKPALDNDELVEVIVNGIDKISKGTLEPPKHFGEPSLEDLRRMQRLFRGRDKAKNMEFDHDGEAIRIGSDIGEKVEKILTGGYSAFGAIEGTLDALNLHGTHPVFTIWDTASGSPVRCSFPKTPEWVKQIEGLLERPVMVRGKVNYFRNGIPRSIAEIKVISDETRDTNLPKATFGSLSSSEAVTDVNDFLKHVREGV